ncbi:hypothetical protein KI387_040338, partial [Taxus chinensis]
MSETREEPIEVSDRSEEGGTAVGEEEANVIREDPNLDIEEASSARKGKIKTRAKKDKMKYDYKGYPMETCITSKLDGIGDTDMGHVLVFELIE